MTKEARLWVRVGELRSLEDWPFGEARTVVDNEPVCVVLKYDYDALSAANYEQAARIAELEVALTDHTLFVSLAKRLIGHLSIVDVDVDPPSDMELRLIALIQSRKELEAELADSYREIDELFRTIASIRTEEIAPLNNKLAQAEQERDTWKARLEKRWEVSDGKIEVDIVKYKKLLEDLDQWKKAFHSVTPGGSEYANDPQACVDFVRKSRSDQYEAILKFKQERDQFHRERDELLKEKCQLQQDHAGEVTNLQRHIQALQKLDTERAVECTALRERVGRMDKALRQIGTTLRGKLAMEPHEIVACVEQALKEA
jgi:hypothetical protein